MSPEETLNELSGVIEKRPALGVAVVTKPQEKEGVGEAQTLALAGEAADYFHDVIEQAVTLPVRKKKWKLVELDPVYKPEPHEVEHASLEDVPAVAMAVERYSNLGPLSEFTGDDEYVKRLLHYVAVLGAPSDTTAAAGTSSATRPINWPHT